jgi:hypothetical protein
MAETPFDAQALIDAAAPALGLTITAAQRPGVVRFLEAARGMAAIVEAVPIPDGTLDLAPTWRPGMRRPPG